MTKPDHVPKKKVSKLYGVAKTFQNLTVCQKKVSKLDDMRRKSFLFQQASAVFSKKKRKKFVLNEQCANSARKVHCATPAVALSKNVLALNSYRKKKLSLALWKGHMRRVVAFTICESFSRCFL